MCGVGIEGEVERVEMEMNERQNETWLLAGYQATMSKILKNRYKWKSTKIQYIKILYDRDRAKER